MPHRVARVRKRARVWHAITKLREIRTVGDVCDSAVVEGPAYVRLLEKNWRLM